MFYVWLQVFYAVLASVALVANRGSWRMVLITLAVIAGLLVPIPMAATRTLWYMECIVVELVVILAVMQLDTLATKPVIYNSFALIAAHLVGLTVGPQPGFGPYRALVPVLETAQILLCICLSTPVVAYLQQLFASDSENLK